MRRTKDVSRSASLMEKIYNGRQNEFDTERSMPLRLRMTVIEMPLPMYDGFVKKCDPSSREYALLKKGHCSAQKGWSLRASLEITRDLDDARRLLVVARQRYADAVLAIEQDIANPR